MIASGISGKDGVDETAILRWKRRRRPAEEALGHVIHGVEGPAAGSDQERLEQLVAEAADDSFLLRLERADEVVDRLAHISGRQRRLGAAVRPAGKREAAAVADEPRLVV